MTPTRQIIVGVDIAFVDLMNSYPVDTSALPSDVAFVGVEGGYRWIERQPFAGRVTDIDDATNDAIDAIFADADAQHAAREAAQHAAREAAQHAAREAAEQQTADDTTTGTA